MPDNNPASTDHPLQIQDYSTPISTGIPDWKNVCDDSSNTPCTQAEEEDIEKQEINDLNAKNIITENVPDENDGPEKSHLVLEMEEETEEIVNISDADLAAKKQSNTYAAKKTVAQGMMDIALITANANQLRYIIEFNSHSSTYILNIVLIVISLILQIAVGMALIFKGRFDMKGESKSENAKRINNYVVVGVFLVTIINVFIASFTVTGSGNASSRLN